MQPETASAAPTTKAMNTLSSLSMIICVATELVPEMSDSNVTCDAPMERAIAMMNTQAAHTASIAPMFMENFFMTHPALHESIMGNAALCQHFKLRR